MDEPRPSRASGLSPCRRLVCRGKRGLAMPESLTGRFDLDLLETTLNGHAVEGVVAFHVWKSLKAELVLILERGGTPG